MEPGAARKGAWFRCDQYTVFNPAMGRDSPSGLSSIRDDGEEDFFGLGEDICA